MIRSVLFFVLALLCGNQLTAQGSRKITAFNTGWNFTKDTVAGKWEAVTLPHTYNKTDMQLGKNFYTGDAYYRKQFSVGDQLKGKRIFLRFEGVGEIATVYVNGKFLTEHRGGYSAFAFEITNVIKYGALNELLVKTNNAAHPDIIPVNHFLFPVYGGIYRPVSMIVTSPVNITVTDYASSGIQIIQKEVSPEKAHITVNAKLENREMHYRDVIMKTALLDSKGNLVVETQKKIALSPQGITYANDSLYLKNPHLWNGIKDPYLYRVDVSLLRNGQEIDRVEQPLGIRNIELIAGKGVFLNGVKYPMYGVTRHQDRWQYGNALSPGQEREDMQLIKEIGATTIRLAHYQQSDHIYSLADSIGFLIWAEIPFVNAVTTKEGANAKQQMEELVRQNRNHPSIYMWGMHNEVYSKTKDDYVPVLTRELNDIAKTNDPYRYTASVNGYGTMDRPENLAGDVQGMNRYYGWYEGAIDDLEKWATTIEQQYPDYKVMLTEYGADGNIDQGSDTLPDRKSIDPVSGQFSPENYQTETHIHQWAIIEKHPCILASYLWNMFEFATPLWNRGGVNARNLKGIVTFDRRRKKDAFYWYKANWSPEPMVYLANRRDSIRTGSAATIQVFANMGPVVLKLNGKTIAGRAGVNDKHWLFDVTLKKGKNKIEAIAGKGKTCSDLMYWTLKQAR
ncbi:beta-galactosidase [Niabella ginsenosidivorans]|uniref:Beta-galactosidase n=1 Tax=Niabella ginsenosidivorans TaxID=1176587 RepID=A0A1A9I4W5_9BACT|nr:glycoside hydrolase family 2 TIM barrel-domain containing protein [Niabella ginsenosidivorans]ANH81711.1 beta-galactosidase [Niabella ginsenosidivorans]